VSEYCTLSVTSYGMDLSAFLPYREKELTATLATDQMLAAYSGWKSVDNYDTCGSVFVVLFNGFMSLTSYFDVMYSY
jgi:hypothetical protein